jgi:hypothetical protein
MVARYQWPARGELRYRLSHPAHIGDGAQGRVHAQAMPRRQQLGHCVARKRGRLACAQVQVRRGAEAAVGEHEGSPERIPLQHISHVQDKLVVHVVLIAGQHDSGAASRQARAAGQRAGEPSVQRSQHIVDHLVGKGTFEQLRRQRWEKIDRLHSPIVVAVLSDPRGVVLAQGVQPGRGVATCTGQWTS